MIHLKQEGPKGTPDFIDILTHDDRVSYENLQKNVGSPAYRYNRNHRLITLTNIFESIKDYCCNKDEDMWKRYLVCGVCWFDNYLAINTRQLRFLISKSKSTINDSLAKMGFISIPVKGEQASLLLETIPFLFGNQSEFRKWSIRLKKSNFSKDINCMDVKKNIENNCDDLKKNCENDFFFDGFFKDCEENDGQFDLDNFNDNVDENFDFEFGYNTETCSMNHVRNDNSLFYAKSTRIY